MAVTPAPPSSTASLVSDKAIRPFLAPTFDPVDFLNATLPTWTPLRPNNPESVSLTELSSSAQAVLSQLNTQLSRLSTTLTALTDDILRSGGRLAYEVEVLRGETSNLSELLTRRLADDLKKFSAPSIDSTEGAQPEHLGTSEQKTGAPDYVTRLHSLAIVRDRLDGVVKVFGQAIDWTVAPSEVSFASTIVGVDGPNARDSVEDLERKGKDCAEKLKNEISDLIGDGSSAGIEAALKRVDELRKLATVWKGTAEERARAKQVDGLAKIIEDRGSTASARSGGYALKSDMVYGSTTI